MSLEEFSNEFQTIVSSYMRFKDFDNKEYLDSIEFDEYEKSLFLTKSQEELVLSLYNGRNSAGNSFEETEELRRYLANLVEEAHLIPISTTNGKPLGIDSKSKFFTLPDKLWFITYEAVMVDDSGCDTMSTLDVVPVMQDEYHKIKRNPFRGANGRRALRLDLSDGVIEIVSKFNVATYYIRYIRKPRPIILVDLPDDVSIEGINVAMPPEIHETLHRRILENAVMLALRSKGYTGEINKNENK